MSAALLIVWTDIPPEVEAAFNDWYSREHLPDRVGKLPGFVRGRRYVAQASGNGLPKYLTLYDLTNAEVMLSPAHVALRKHRKPNDLRFVPLFRNTIKGICDVMERIGGEGGDAPWLVLLPVSGGVDGGVIARLGLMPGIANVTLALRNDVVTAASSAKDDRAGDRYVDGLMVLEAMSEGAAREAARMMKALLPPPRFVDAPVVLRRLIELRA
jgi:hypothetical protein